MVASDRDRLALRAGGLRTKSAPPPDPQKYAMSHCNVWFSWAAADIADADKQDNARRIDDACGQAMSHVKALMTKLNGVSLTKGSVPADVGAALKFHFKIDASDKANQPSYDRLYKIYSDMQRDFGGQMDHVYEIGMFNRSFGNPAYTSVFNPSEIHIHDRLLISYTMTNDLAWALFHEQAHYSSRSAIIKKVTVTDRTYFGSDKESTKQYPRLTTEQALTNADTYVFFAMDLVDPNNSDIKSMHAQLDSKGSP